MPRKKFPLFEHATGQWAKKIKGRLVYFGKDKDEALRKYRNELAKRQQGIDPRAQGLNIGLLVDKFLNAKRLQMAAGELSRRTWSDYFAAAGMLVEAFGVDRVVADLRPEDFSRFRAKLAESQGPVTLGNSILRVRIIFKWAADNRTIERPVWFGTDFTRPKAKTMRRAKRESGSRMFEANELRGIIDAAGVTMKAMVLLGVNCGFGQSDVANLPLEAIDLAGGWIDYPRPKTEIARRCRLWPETVEALADAIAERPDAKSEADAGLAFLTCRGARWVRDREHEDGRIVFIDGIGQEFNKVLARLQLKRRGGFYNLRHVFRTIADRAKDGPAVDVFMGHVDPSMGANYRERIDDDRLRAVADLVRAWLWHPPLVPPGSIIEPTTPAATPGEWPAVVPFAAAAGWK
jgi:integrase